MTMNEHLTHWQALEGYTNELVRKSGLCKRINDNTCSGSLSLPFRKGVGG